MGPAVLIDQNRMDWKEETLKRFFFSLADVLKIMRINLPPTPMEDFFAWHYEKMAFCRLGVPITWPDRRTEELGDINRHQIMQRSDQCGRSTGKFHCHIRF
jgi:hypothetical protein